MNLLYGILEIHLWTSLKTSIPKALATPQLIMKIFHSTRKNEVTQNYYSTFTLLKCICKCTQVPNALPMHAQYNLIARPDIYYTAPVRKLTPMLIPCPRI
jgi:hypothetical protein